MEKQMRLPDITNMEKFNNFHRDNPSIYRYFKQYALGLIGKVHSRISSKLIIERIRYEVMIETTEAFKINNNYTALYARLFIRDYPQYYNWFEFRQLRTV